MKAQIGSMGVEIGSMKGQIASMAVQIETCKRAAGNLFSVIDRETLDDRVRVKSGLGILVNQGGRSNQWRCCEDQRWDSIKKRIKRAGSALIISGFKGPP
jgi:hypothetical protein